MASRSDIEAGKAHVLVYVKNQVAAGLNAIGGQLKGLGSQAMSAGTGISAAGAAIIAPFVAAISHFTDAGSALADMSARTGQSVGSLAELKFAAEQTGSSLEAVEKAIKFQQKSGSTETFDEIAARISAIEDPAKRTQAAIKAWGKAGTELLPMVNNLAALRQEARDLGLVPTEEAVNMADAIGDSLDKVKGVFSATLFEIGAAIAPVLIPALDITVKIAATVGRWIRENSQLVRTIALIGAGLLAAGAAVTAIGGAIFVLGTAFTAIAGAVTAVGAILGTSLATILSPVGILVAVLGGAALLWLKFSDSGKAAISAVMAELAPFLHTIKGTLQGIFDALAGGDLMLAGKIAITGLQLVLQQGLLRIVEMIGGTLGDALGSIGTDLIQGDFAGAWQTAVAGMAATWDSFAAGIVEVMAAVVGKIKQLWDAAVIGIRGSIAGLRGIVGVTLGGTKAGKALDTLLSTADSAVGVGGAVGSTVLGVGKSATDIVAAAARDREAKSSDAFNKRIASGADRARQAADDLGRQLDDLTGQAANARAKAAERFAAESPASVTAEAKSSVAGTFSAAAFLALAQGGKTGLERIADEQLKEQRRHTQLLDEQVQKTTNLERALKVA